MDTRTCEACGREIPAEYEGARTARGTWVCADVYACRDALRERLLAVREALALDSAYPVTSVLRTLADFGQHALQDHDCDAHGWEVRAHATNVAPQLADAIEAALRLGLLAILFLLCACDDAALSPVVRHDAGARDGAPEAGAVDAGVAPPLPPPTLIMKTNIPPPAGVTDLDMEVCRSINTTCGGFWPQSRCRKSKKSWTARLTSEQVNCIIAAQGLLDVQYRAEWIRECGAFDCRNPGHGPCGDTSCEDIP
jgi:hypothetical protein